MKALLQSRGFKFAGWVALGAFLFEIVGGWKHLSDMIVDDVSAAIAAIAITAILACYWAASGRSEKDLKEFGWYGSSLDRNHRDLKIGLFVRFLCGVMALAAGAGLLTLVVLLVLVFNRSAVSLSPAMSIEDWAVFMGGIGLLSIAAAFFGYIAILGRVPMLGKQGGSKK